MSEEAGFLEAIFAHPMDNTARLVYADWLEEQATDSQVARAEFIRISISLTQHGIWPLSITGSLPDGVQEVLQRANTLLDTFGLDWVQASGLPAPVSPHFTLTARGWQAPNSFPPPSGRIDIGDYDVPEWTWWRGFVGRLTCSRSFWRSHATAVFRAQPITEVHVHRVEPADGSQIVQHTATGASRPLAGTWFWANETAYPNAPVIPAQVLPADVFACLGMAYGRLPSAGDFDSHERLARYSDHGVANLAASLAFVQRGRALAGHSALPSEESLA